jgi:hypothetical protein
MTRLSATLLLACCLTMTRAYETASAQDDRSAAVPPEYDQEVDRGLDEFEAGNFAEARSRFSKAHAIFPNARTFRALGKAEYELKNYSESARYFELALASEVRPLTAEQRVEAQRLLDNTRAYLSRYSISTAPPDATLLLNGNPVQLASDGTLQLSVGDHVLEASAEGYVAVRRELQVMGGETRQLSIELRPIVTETSPIVAPMPSAPRDDRTPLRKKWWLWTGVAGVVAGGVVASVLLLRRDREPEQRLGGNTGVVGRIGNGASE